MMESFLYHGSCSLEDYEQTTIKTLDKLIRSYTRNEK